MIMDMEKKGKHCHKIKNMGAVFGSVYLTGTSQKYCLVLLGIAWFMGNPVFDPEAAITHHLDPRACFDG